MDRQVAWILTVGFVGLAVLLVGSGIGFTLPISLQAGKTYCSCACKTADYSPVELMWVKVATCAVNGRACKAKIEGHSYPGTLANCQTCKAVKDEEGVVGLDQCKTARLLGGIFQPKHFETAPTR